MSLSVKLILEEGASVQVFEFDQGAPSISIGRTQENEITIKSTTSSRQHCKVSRTEEGFVVEDLASRNGTQVNGAPVKSQILAIGDRIEIGTSYIHFGERLEKRPQPGPGESQRRAEGRRKTTDRQRRKSDRKRSLKGGAAGPASRYALDPIAAPGVTAPVPVENFPFMIGSRDSNSLVLQASSVAPEHAMLVPADAGLFLVDLGSPTGTTIEGKRVVRELVTGHQVIGIGTASFRLLDRKSDGAGPGTKKPVDVEEVTNLDDLGGDEDDDASQDATDINIGGSGKKPVRSRGSARRPGAKLGKGSTEDSDAEIAPLDDDEGGGLGAELQSIDANKLALQPSLLARFQAPLVVLIMGLVFVSSATLLRGLLEVRAADPAAENNLTQNWSFEEALGSSRIPGWSLSASEGAKVSIVKRRRHGRRALMAKLGAGSEVTITAAESARIAGDRSLSVRGIVTTQGEALVGLRVAFVDESGRELGERIAVVSARSGEQRLSGTVAPPARAVGARLIAFIQGRGAVLAHVDRLELSESEDKLKIIRLNGVAARVEVDRRLVARMRRRTKSGAWETLASRVGVGLIGAEEHLAAPYGDLGAARVDMAASLSGRKLTFQGALFQASAAKWRRLSGTIAKAGKGLKFRYLFQPGELAADQKARIDVTVPRLRRVAPVMVIDVAGRANSLAELFKRGTSSEISVSGLREMAWGKGEAQVSLRFSAPATLIARRLGTGLELGFVMLPSSLEGGGRSLGFELLSSSTLVRERIRTLFARAQTARKAGNLAAALKVYREVSRDYGFDKSSASLARSREAELVAQAKEPVGDVSRALDDVENLSPGPVLTLARRRTAELAKSFPGSEWAETAKRDLAAAEKRGAARSEQRRRARSEEILAVGLRHLRAHRPALARAAFELLVADYPPELEAVTKAKAHLSQLGGS